MKPALFYLVIFTAFLNFSCRRNVESSPIATNDGSQSLELTSPPTPTPDKYAESDVFDLLPNSGEENQKDLLEYNGYKIKRVKVKKRDEYDNPEADIYDAVISKKGKTIARIEGDYHPLGNIIKLELYQFLGDAEKQLLIVDVSNRHDHACIVSLSPKYELIFDAADYDVLYGGLMLIDINNDGEKEITLRTWCDFGFEFSNVDQPWVRIIFKYDTRTRRYLPASHLFAEFTLKEQQKQIQRLNEGKITKFPAVLDIVMTYIYAGKENEGWKFFDDNLPERFIHYGLERDREQIKAKLRAELQKDSIYKFIKADLKKNVQN